MPKIYTKTGDRGKTSTLGGKRVCKCCLEMEAVGEVDELNAFLGILIEEMNDEKKLRNKEIKKLVGIQHQLFTIGSNLAALQVPLAKVPKLRNLEIKKLENLIDLMQKDLPELRNFILPGGCEEAALSFYARAICRRAERCVIKLAGRYAVPSEVKKYLNRLSDYLFVLARWLNLKKGVAEAKWQK